jgi:hypothetical protein
MEVHQHTHTPRKKWFHYMWEFFMLFLAVFCGFLAESFREKMIIHEKEKHYIENLVEDIKKDTAEMSGILYAQGFLHQKMEDALSIPVSRLRNIQSQDSFFHHFFYFYSFVATFTQHDNTYTQLKNAGGFSVVHKKDVIDSISLFYTNYEHDVEHNSIYYIDYYNKIVQIAMQVMDMPEIPSDFNDPMFVNMPDHVEFITQYNIPLLKQLYSAIRYDKGCLQYYMLQEKAYMIEAAKLLRFLNKKYHLE